MLFNTYFPSVSPFAQLFVELLGQLNRLRFISSVIDGAALLSKIHYFHPFLYVTTFGLMHRDDACITWYDHFSV